MLIRMYAGNIAASINVREVLKSLTPTAITERRGVSNCAFVDVGCSGINIGGASVGNCRERQVINTLRRAAATEKISAVCDSGTIELAPGSSFVQSFPDPLVDVVCIDIPDVHLIACGLI